MLHQVYKYFSNLKVIPTFVGAKNRGLKRLQGNNKIINDPVHGFISIPGGFIYRLVSHAWFQRLRYIKQLGLTEYVYPGATHSRLQHSLGALHLMTLALDTLSARGISISGEEKEAAQAAILLHDTGHAPFSHALEFELVREAGHEYLSLLVMQSLNRQFDGALSLAIEMFRGEYKRKFFHDLISSQIDMDRLDYLVRDSFYSGVIEGSVGSDRIIKMLNVVDDRLVVDEKGIYSIEKFLIARRLMYWQVYMHKTVISADKLLVGILERARELFSGDHEPETTPGLKYFLEKNISCEDLASDKENNIISRYLKLDDNEIITSIKMWRQSSDPVLSELAERLLDRRLFAIELSDVPFHDNMKSVIMNILGKYRNQYQGCEEKYVLAGEVSNRTYAPAAPGVRILSKDGKLKEITEVSDILNHKALSKNITKYYLCYPKEIRGKI